jgi:aminoglycoside 3-N-acetyltransferase
MQSLKRILKKVLPSRALIFLFRARRKIVIARVRSLPVLTERAFTTILTDELGLKNGDVVFVHSSVDQLNLGFHVGRALAILQRITGPRGTLLFPTYPPVESYEFLSRGGLFDVRKSPSYTGILTEIARRSPKALRSLHPTKSVCAIGPHARELVSTHQCSIYPYDQRSPYYKIMEYGAKVVGIGVSTRKLSFAHRIEDELQGQFPVDVYHERLFSARCINYSGEEEIVRTYAHDMSKMNHNTRRFMKRYISEELCKDLTIQGMNFFCADSQRLFPAMIELAKAGITIYPRSSYSRLKIGNTVSC